MDLTAHVAARLAACGVTGPVVVGVSGGMDSTVLLDALVRAGVPVVGVHVHHGLRGADSDADAAHAQALCQARGVPFVLHRAQNPPVTGRQAWGRALRYQVFEAVGWDHGAGWVATAHHADDQAETVLMALLRGTGPRGLAGMPEVRRLSRGLSLVRPLLGVLRAELRVYAEAHGLVWREDATNRDRHYRRVAIRLDILRRLERLLPGASRRIARTASLVRAERTLAAPASEALLASALVDTPEGGHVRSGALVGLAEEVRTWVLLEAARRYLGHPGSADLAARLDHLLRSHVGRRLVWGLGTAYRTRTGLAFVRRPAPGKPEEHRLDEGESVPAARGWLELQPVTSPPMFVRDPNVAYFDADALALPLTVRVWQPGDRFVPFGSCTPRRLSDVLTNEKIEPDERARTLVVLDARGEIVAVVGVRPGHVAPVTDSTRRVLCLRYRPDAS
ncbi:MAG TPA: tRNA lysidine(34) synthetase TilS [Rhodothermales bacterium]|nr:tRNA lysidine(34) synthetase TilS [Rhodothermales bacterium]